MNNAIYRYYLNLYKSENFSEENKNETYTIEESLFTHLKDGTQDWVLGIKNNRTKTFVLQAITKRDPIILEKFLKEHIKSGNIIVHESWAGYNCN